MGKKEKKLGLVSAKYSHQILSHNFRSKLALTANNVVKSVISLHTSSDRLLLLPYWDKSETQSIKGFL